MNLYNNLTLSLIIPVYNGGEKFKDCLYRLQKFAQLAKEIVIVADGDTDASRDLAKNFGDNFGGNFDVKVIVNDSSFGPAYARNQGAKIATGDLLFFLDADVTIKEETILKILDFFSKNQDIFAVIGSYDDSPSATNFLSQYKNLFHHYTHQKGNENASTFWGACGIIRREVFEKIGGFNENYRLPSVEDIELGYRLKQAGYQIRLCKDIQVKHLKKWTIISLLKADIFQRAIPWTVLLLKYQQIINDLNLNWQNRASVILVYLSLIILILSWWWHWLLIIILFNFCLLLLINQDVYQFFQAKKGTKFALLTIPWHWLYFFYGGLGLAIGFLIYQKRNLFKLTINKE